MALDFDGVDDGVEHGDIAGIDGTATLTVMLWTYVDTLELSAAFSSKSLASSTETYSLGIMNDDTSVLVFRGNAQFHGNAPTGTLVTGVWMHLAVAYDGAGVGNSDKVKLYKNGVGLSLTFPTAPPTTLADSVAGAVRTFRFLANAVFLDGRAAHHKIWLAPLTAPEIIQEMNSYRPVRTANLVLSSPYDDGVNARDYSGNGNHGTVAGALQAPVAPPVSYGAEARQGPPLFQPPRWRRGDQERLWHT